VNESSIWGAAPLAQGQSSVAVDVASFDPDDPGEIDGILDSASFSRMRARSVNLEVCDQGEWRPMRLSLLMSQ